MPRSILRRIVDRIGAADPALSRLRLASRAILSLVLNAALLFAIGRVIALPVAAYGIAVTLSFTGSMAIREATHRAQLATRGYAALASISAFTVATLLARRTVIADVGFLAVIFVATYVRRHGVRWVAVGTLAYMSYFMGDYLKAAPADLSKVALAVALALLVTQVVTTKLLTDDPERDFRHATATFGRLIDLLLRDLLAAPPEGRLPEDDARALQAHLAHLREIALMDEGFLPQGEDGSLAARGPASDIALALFELQLIVERVVGAHWSTRTNRGLIRAVLEHDEPTLGAARARLEGASSTSARDMPSRLLLRLVLARVKLATLVAESGAAAFAARGVAAKPLASPAERPTVWGVPAAFQAPIQVTLACAAALVGGSMLSPTRWYWAVLTAFIVFSNTGSRADAALRAAERSAGTLAGLAGGVVLATLLHGHPVVGSVGVVSMFFLSFYFQQVSYSLMIFLTTLGLALLYGVMGMFTPGLLVLRLEETVIGSAAGAFAAFFVFPSYTSVSVGDALRDYLESLDALASAAREKAHGMETGNLLALSRALDRRYAALATLARPLHGMWAVATRFGDVRKKLLLLTGCTHWARTLANGLGARPDDADLPRIDELVADVHARTAALLAVRARWFDRRTAPAAAIAQPAVMLLRDDDPAFALESIAALLARAIDA